jgi:hypothetical protein
MGAIDIIRKMIEKKREKTPLNIGKGVSPDEVELASYKEEERRDNIRIELAKYRRRKDHEMIVGGHYAALAKKLYGNQQLLEQKNLMAQKNCFNHSGKNLLNASAKNILKRRKR